MKKNFKECKTLILNKVEYLHGTKNEELEIIQELAYSLSKGDKNGELTKIINAMPSTLKGEILKLNEFIKLKNKMLSETREICIYDIVKELMRATKTAGFNFVKNGDVLYFWTGTYFQPLEEWEIRKFIFKEFFFEIELPKKDYTTKTCTEVLKNLHAWADRLDVKKLEGK